MCVKNCATSWFSLSRLIICDMLSAAINTGGEFAEAELTEFELKITRQVPLQVCQYSELESADTRTPSTWLQPTIIS